MKIIHWGFCCSHNNIQLWTPWFYFNSSNWYSMPYMAAYEIGTSFTLHKHKDFYNTKYYWNTLRYITAKQIVKNRWNLRCKGA